MSPVLTGFSRGYQPGGPGTKCIPWSEIDELFEDVTDYEDFEKKVKTLRYLTIEESDDFKVMPVNEKLLFKVDYKIFCEEDLSDFIPLMDKLEMMLNINTEMNEDMLHQALATMAKNGVSQEGQRCSVEQQMLYELEEIRTIIVESLISSSDIFNEELDWKSLMVHKNCEIKEGILYDENHNFLGEKGPVLEGIILTFFSEKVNDDNSFSGHLFIGSPCTKDYYDVVYHG